MEAGVRQHHRVTLAILAVACTSYALMQTAVTPALGTFQRDLHTNSTWSTWIVTSYLLAAAVSTPILGKLGDQYGKKRLLLVALAIFLVGCIGSAAAWNIWAMIGFRALQGTAGALFPLSFAIIRDEFPRERVGSAIALLSSIFGIGAGVGLVVSGLIVDNVSWRWLFISPAIAIVVSFVAIVRLVPESPIKTLTKVDVPGAFLFGVGLGMLLLGLSEAEHWGWTSKAVLGLFAGGVLVLAAWVWVEQRVPEPLIEIHVFVQRPVLLANAAALTIGVTMFASFVFMPLFMETPRGMSAATARLADYGFGLTATKAGLTMLSGPLGMLAAGSQAGRIGAWLGMKWPLSAGCLLMGIATASLAIWHAHPWQFVVAQGVIGLGTGLAMGAMPTLITESVRQTETGVANGMNMVVRTVGMVIGAQLGAVFLAAYTIGQSGVPSVTGFEVTFVVGAVCGVVAAALAVFVTPTRRRSRRELALAGSTATHR